jgi:hypothetical protein
MAAEQLLFCESDKCKVERKRYPASQMTFIFSDKPFSWTNKYCKDCAQCINVHVKCHLCSKLCSSDSGYIEYEEDEYYCTYCLISYQASYDDQRLKPEFKIAIRDFQNGLREQSIEKIEYLIRTAKERKIQNDIVQADERKKMIFSFLNYRLEIPAADVFTLINRMPERTLTRIFFEKGFVGGLSSFKIISALLE